MGNTRPRSFSPGRRPRPAPDRPEGTRRHTMGPVARNPDRPSRPPLPPWKPTAQEPGRPPWKARSHQMGQPIEDPWITLAIRNALASIRLGPCCCPLGDVVGSAVVAERTTITSCAPARASPSLSRGVRSGPYRVPFWRGGGAGGMRAMPRHREIESPRPDRPRGPRLAAARRFVAPRLPPRGIVCGSRYNNRVTQNGPPSIIEVSGSHGPASSLVPRLRPARSGAPEVVVPAQVAPRARAPVGPRRFIRHDRAGHHPLRTAPCSPSLTVGRRSTGPYRVPSGHGGGWGRGPCSR